VKNVTLLNAYRGIGLNVPPFERSNHELSRVENVKGTVLYRGLEARNSSDVGNWRNIHFSNRYWADAPTAYNPPPRATLDSWTRANGTAFTFADVEWDNFYRLSAEDYHVGIHFVDGARIAFAGQFYDVAIADSTVAIKADPDSIDSRRPHWGASFWRSALEGSVAAVENNSAGHIHLANSSVAGAFGGKYAERVRSTATASPAAEPYMEIASPPKPTRSVLYDVTRAPYHAPSTLGRIPAHDATGAIQSALNEAGEAGGGVVYLPAGWYRISSGLSVPANVELRGSSAVMNRSHPGLSNGTVLFAYREGADNPALITLDGANAGVRGLRVFYPGNRYARANSFKYYPYALRINGVADAWIVNVAIENGFRGVIAEPGSDGHYIRDVVGATTHGFIRIGASKSGWIENCHSNINFWPRNGYRVGEWMVEGRDVFWGDFLATRKRNDYLIQIENALDERLLNNFSYGGKHGIQALNSKVQAVNTGTDNVGGHTVVAGEGAVVRVVNSMRYNGSSNTAGAAESHNEMNLD
ncbi:MAG: glycosyl hydrolase family 28-related protein, partial [Halioglobus sp.]|nr:glycosyl hydrolase family 28-related protein [Halioglobus sp.]